MPQAAAQDSHSSFFWRPSRFVSVTYQPKDGYFRRAKKEGFRSRAAYKLVELNSRFHLIRPSARVVDLGAAPGGWLQIASQLAGHEGRVFGFDLKPIQPFPQSNIATYELDLTGPDALAAIRGVLEEPVDCVLSDVSPRLSGIRDVDLSRALDLAQGALRIACAILKPRGCFLAKTFTGGEVSSLATEMEARFQSLQRTRVEASRKGSSEIYLVAKGFRGDPMRDGG